MITISQYTGDSVCNAGSKAKIDIEKILEKKYNSKSRMFRLKGDEDSSRLKTMIHKMKKAIFALRFLHTNELTVIQFPFINNINFTKNVLHKIALIHDLEGIRKQDERIRMREIAFLDTCEYIIAHNEKMKEFLIENKISADKIYSLELFDYLCDEREESENIVFDKSKVKVIYTGNLDKAPFLKQIESQKMNFTMNVYGLLTGKFENDKIIYKGTFLPDELPKNIEGDIGLVWDGNLDESDENTGFKNYTKYNNPHKLSCYIAGDMPVIVWKKSAISDFVKKYNIGYTIKSIYDINNIDFSDYSTKKENVVKLRRKSKRGIFH